MEQELGWTNLVLRKQLFKAFDLDGHGDVDFREFCEAYSVMLRGTVPELLDFAWRVYHMQGSPDRVRIDDMYNVLRLALGGLEEVRRKQGKGAGVSHCFSAPATRPLPASATVTPQIPRSTIEISPFAGGTSEESRFPDRSARAMLTAVFGQTKQLLTKREFSIGVLRHRMIVDCIVPGFELIPQDALHRAAEAGEVEEVQHLLEVDRLDVNGEDALQWPTTPLHLAAKMGHADIVRELIARGANPRLLGPEGETALDLSIENGKQGTLAAMLESGADPLMRNGAGRTPLHTAAACGNIKALDLLMPNLAQRVTTLRDKAGDTPVHCAALGDHFMAINTFLEYEVLCAADVDPAELNSANLRGETPLHVACMSRAYRTARRLLELGADKHALDLEGQGLLHKACAEGGNEVVLEMLLEDESEDGLDVGEWAEGRLERRGGLVVRSVDTRSRVDYLVTSGELAIRISDGSLVLGNADLQDNAGLTPLNICVSRRDIKMLKLLINAGADPNIAELSTGYTPLHKVTPKI